MSHDSIEQLEDLFHELSVLSDSDRDARLDSLSETDLVVSTKLRSMFASITNDPAFMDPSVIEMRTPIPVHIPVDGSVVLADRYTIIECIGMGGSSTVFRAKATSPDRDVAIKMLRFGLSSSQARDRFDVESRALATLTHPHIAHIYQTGVYSVDHVDVPWIAMELIQGSRTIMRHVKNKNLNTIERVGLFSRVCEAIEDAHNSGLLHLDLNVSNVLIDSHGYPKIIDFGLAGLIYSSRPKNLASIGTRTSMAPEQTLFSSTPFDQRTDVYGLGLLFIELLTGQQLQAFDGRTHDESRHLIAIGKARELLAEIDDFPELYRGIVDRMIRVDPEDRFSTVGEVLGQLRGSTRAGWSRKPLAVATGVSFLVIVIGMLGLFIQDIWPISNSGQINESGNQSTLGLAPELAIGLSSKNPRSSEYSADHEQLISGIASALTTSDRLAGSDAVALHAALADTDQIAGRYESAISHYQQSINLLSHPESAIDRNWILLSLANVQLFLGRAEQAEESLLLIDRAVDSDAVFLLDLGIAETGVHILLGADQQAHAQIRYTRGILDGLSLESKLERVDRMIHLSELLAQIGETDESLELLYETRRFVDERFPSLSTKKAFVEVAIANALFDPDTPELSTKVQTGLEQAIDTFEIEGDLFHASWASRQLGNFHLATGDPETAIEIYSRAEGQLSSLLGADHHETLVCSAYKELALIATGNDLDIHTDAFHSLIEKLSEVLGSEHSILNSLSEVNNRVRIPEDRQTP